MKLKVGDKVALKSDMTYVKVIRLVGEKQLVVEDEYGFDYTLQLSDVYKVGEAGKLEQLAVSEADVAEKHSTKQKKKLLTAATAEFLKEGADWLEIDLHIENLTDKPKRLSNAEIVQKQMVYFERYFHLAKQYRKRRYIIIHGVGQGVLRQEIRARLKQFDGIEFSDADYSQYGVGATEVYFFQNVR